MSVFTSKIDILLPSYLKSASESVHQLYGASEALSYLEYIEELAHPAIYLLEYIMSRAPSDIGDVNGVLGGRPQPPSPPTSVYASPSLASPPAPLGPLDLLKKHDIVRSFSEFHIKRDATYIAPVSVDIKDIYNRLRSLPPTTRTSPCTTSLACTSEPVPVHRNDVKLGYIVLNEKEFKHLWDNNEIKLTMVDIPMTHGYPNLCQHIHIHQQATDAINFKITSCILLGSNDKIDVNWKKDYFAQKLYLVALAIMVDEPRTRNILRPYRRDSSQHHVPSIGNVFVILRGPTSQDIYDKVNHPGIVSSHVFDQAAISGPLDSHTHSLISLCAHETMWNKAHRHIQMYFPHVTNIIKWQEEATSTSKTTLGRTSAASSTSTLTTNIMHNKGATITIKYNDDNVMEID